MDLELEIGGIVDLAKELIAGGQREAAGILLKSSMEPLRKAYQDDFLADIAASTRQLAKARGIPFDTKVTQSGDERVFIFKTGYHEVEHRAHGHEVQVNLRKTVPGACPFKDLALAKAIQIKLQRVYAQMGDTLMAKTEELLKAKVDDHKTRWVSDEAAPRIKRAMRQTRKEHPSDPLAAKKPLLAKMGPTTKDAVVFTNELRLRHAINGPRKEVKNFGSYQRKRPSVSPSEATTAVVPPPKLKLVKGDVVPMGDRRGKPQGPAVSGSAQVLDAPKASGALRIDTSKKPKAYSETPQGKLSDAAFLQHATAFRYHLKLGINAGEGDDAPDAHYRMAHHHAKALGYESSHHARSALGINDFSSTETHKASPKKFKPHKFDSLLGEVDPHRDLNKGEVVDMASHRKPKAPPDDAWHEPSPKAQAAMSGSKAAPVIGKLIHPNDHMDALEHHVDHLTHHNLHHLKAARAGKEGLAMQHEALAEQHYNHALTHAKRIGRGKHDIAFMQGLIAQERRTLAPEHPILTFKSHPHDAALGGRLMTSKDMNKSSAAARGAQILMKVMHRRRPPRTKRALGRKKRTQGVWSEHSKVRGKQSQLQANARRQTQATQQSSGIMDAIASLFGG